MRGIKLSAILLVGLAGCSKQAVAPGSKQATIASVSGTAGAPTSRSIRWNVEQPGSIQAYETTPMFAKLPGFVSKVLVDMDDRVTGPELGWYGEEKRPGTLLAEISIPELDDEWRQKEAHANEALAGITVAERNLDVAKANLDSAGTTVTETEAALKRAAANDARWTSETKRVDDMVARKVIDKQTAEETRNQATAAKSEMEEAEARIASAKAKLRESKAKLAQAESEVAAAKARHSAAIAEVRRVASLKQYTKITAPYDGVVTQRNVHTGHYLKDSAKEPLFVVSRIDPVRVFVDVPESAAARIAKGSIAKVRVPSLRGEDIAGTVARTSWSLSPDIRTLRVEIELPNPTGRIRPGSFCTVGLPIDQAEAIVLPASAVFVQDELPYCWVLADGKAAKHQLALGQKDGDFVEILRMKKADAKGTWAPVKGDEKILLKWEGPIADGAVVQVK